MKRKTKLKIIEFIVISIVILGFANLVMGMINENITKIDMILFIVSLLPYFSASIWVGNKLDEDLLYFER